jgi:hypothetical protein
MFDSTELAADIKAAEENCNCPCCDMAGWTPERVRAEAPEYMAELDALPPQHVGIPDAPAGAHLCWDCRRLAYEGVGHYARRARAIYAHAGHPVTHLLLAHRSYHYCGYDNRAGNSSCGYSYTGPRDPSLLHADRAVTHIELRSDVEVAFNDVRGASATWDPAKGCPFVFKKEEEHADGVPRDRDRQSHWESVL